jgi:type II secretory pathway pseudopilin PulG
MTRVTPFRRRAFTIVEALVAFAVLSVAMVLVAQFVGWAITERVRTDARMEATDAAANVLEEARAIGADGLTPEWAASRKLPEHLASRLPGGTLTGRVEAEDGRPRVKRVTVEVKWTNPGGTPARPVVLVALFAERSAGGKP